MYPEDIQIGRAHPSKSEKWLSIRTFCHERELNEAVYHKNCFIIWGILKTEKSIIPDNEKIRVTVIGECIHKLIYWLPEGPDSPYLSKTMSTKKQPGKLCILISLLRII